MRNATETKKNTIMTNSIQTQAKVLYINLGYIGNTAEKLQSLFEGYSTEPNEYGFYLKFENYSDLVVNQGVIVETNCWKKKKQFKKALFSKLLFNLDK